MSSARVGPTFTMASFAPASFAALTSLKALHTIRLLPTTSTRSADCAADSALHGTEEATVLQYADTKHGWPKPTSAVVDDCCNLSYGRIGCSRACAAAAAAAAAVALMRRKVHSS